MRIHRLRKGRYEVTIGKGREALSWIIWRGYSKRWYGTCEKKPGEVIDAPTFRVAKYDLLMGYTLGGRLTEDQRRTLTLKAQASS